MASTPNRTAELSSKLADHMGKLGITAFVLSFRDPDSDQDGYLYSDELYALRRIRDLEDSILYQDEDE